MQCYYIQTPIFLLQVYLVAVRWVRCIPLGDLSDSISTQRKHSKVPIYPCVLHVSSQSHYSFKQEHKLQKESRSEAELEMHTERALQF